jgi:hypothetical protein
MTKRLHTYGPRCRENVPCEQDHVPYDPDGFLGPNGEAFYDGPAHCTLCGEDIAQPIGLRPAFWTAVTYVAICVFFPPWSEISLGWALLFGAIFIGGSYVAAHAYYMCAKGMRDLYAGIRRLLS